MKHRAALSKGLRLLEVVELKAICYLFKIRLEIVESEVCYEQIQIVR